MPFEVSKHYLELIRSQFEGTKRLAEGALAQLSDEEMFAALDAESNSVAVIIKHLVGNMRSRFTDFKTTDGEKPDRNRDREFEMNAATTRQEVMCWWEEGWSLVFAAVDSVQPPELMQTVTIRGETHTILQALNRQITHYAYHVGQIVFLAKHYRTAGWKSLSIPKGKSEEYKGKLRA